ncbi:MAG: leucine-rich repeat protein, partial [Muribaculaceae bacterium]|nr:leucine-rich repeat protein [Muribaculaceae bacterium]
MGREDLKSVVIPDSVTKICNYAFNHCSNLTSVTIPNSVKIIGHYAFDDCTNLK